MVDNDYRRADWEKRAKCMQVVDDERDLAEQEDRDPQITTDTWYPPRDRSQYRPIAIVAKAVCKGKDGRAPCPVRTDCLRTAIATDEPFGIWGGMSHRERNALVRKAERGPRTLDQLIDNLDRTWETPE